jgi:hypothetical protein
MSSVYHTYLYPSLSFSVFQTLPSGTIGSYHGEDVCERLQVDEWTLYVSLSDSISACQTRVKRPGSCPGGKGRRAPQATLVPFGLIC